MIEESYGQNRFPPCFFDTRVVQFQSKLQSAGIPVPFPAGIQPDLQREFEVFIVTDIIQV